MLSFVSQIFLVLLLKLCPHLPCILALWLGTFCMLADTVANRRELLPTAGDGLKILFSNEHVFVGFHSLFIVVRYICKINEI